MKNTISYHVVDYKTGPKFVNIKAMFHNHFIELIYEAKDVKGQIMWFGKIVIDGNLYWQSPASFGCNSKEILNDEMQHRLYTWALKEGYISHHKLAP